VAVVAVIELLVMVLVVAEQVALFIVLRIQYNRAIIQ
jgi:hypothetical protein